MSGPSAGSLAVDGGGTMILNGANPYSGATTLSAGTLAVNGSLSASPITVTGGVLGGTGTVGSTTIASGGTLAPGNSIGTLHINGNLSLAAGSIYNVEVSPTASDLTIVSGTARLNGTLATNFPGGTYSLRKYTVIISTGALSGTFAALTGVPPWLRYDLGPMMPTTPI